VATRTPLGTSSAAEQTTRRSNTKSPRRQSHRGARWPYDTVLCGAYLLALVNWAARHVSDTSATITIPTGRVTATELMRVLAALDGARRERAS
jgi:hypothetical protein